MPRIIKPVAKGDFTSATLSVDSQGRVVSASSGAGAANMKTLLYQTGPASGNVALSNNANKVQAYLFGGGGGGGGGFAPGNVRGGTGGQGGFGYFVANATGGATIPYSIGGGGNSGNNSGGTSSNPTGNAGAATNFHNFTANGGGGGPGTTTDTPGTTGTSGSAPGSSGTISKGILFVDQRGAGGAGQPQPGGTGTGGGLVVFSNEG